MSQKRISNQPLYVQLRDALAGRIAKGEWKAGVALPNEFDLAREFGVSSGTVRKALDQLEVERLLIRRQGRGTFVHDQASDERAVRFTNIRSPDGTPIAGEVTSFEIVEAMANQDECARLRLRRQDRVYRVHRIRHFRGQPFMVEDASMPAALFPDLTSEPNLAHRIVVLAQHFGILLGKAEERVSIGTTSVRVAKALRLAPAAPILVLDRVIMARDGCPVEWRVGYCDGGETYYLSQMG